MEKYTKVSNPTEYAKVEEKDLLGFQRDDLPEGARPIYSKGLPVKVLKMGVKIRRKTHLTVKEPSFLWKARSAWVEVQPNCLSRQAEP